MKIELFDTTLRDGTQAEGVNLTVHDKITIALKLDDFGINYIEGGWPGSNPKDKEFFNQIKKHKLKNAQICAFGSTARDVNNVEGDVNLNALIQAETPVISIFGKTWDLHSKNALNLTDEQNAELIYKSIKYLKSFGRQVIFDAEHFFDGYKANSDFAIKMLIAAKDAGADLIALCDTNGGTMSWELGEIITPLVEKFAVPLGIHVHNDAGCAVGNSLVAIKSGCKQVQGTINGYGERCGNADLCSIIPNLELKMKRQVLPSGNLKHLSEVSHYIAEISNMPHHNSQPFVGYGAFAHKGGIHVSALLKDSLTYEHINPEEVGNHRRVLVSELSGLSNLLYKARELKLDVNSYDDQTRKVIKQIKEMENQGFQFEGADASLELFLRKAFGHFEDYFQLKNLKIIMEKDETQNIVAEAMVKVSVGDEIFHTAAEGDGPVNALDNSLRKALREVYPEIDEMHLADYKVRVLNEKAGTAAKVRVLIESADQSEKWSTVGVSENIIEASWQAIVDSINYMLMKRNIIS